MKTNNILAAVVLLSAMGLTAFSIGASAANNADNQGKTRAQVRAELIQARADGYVPSSEEPEVFYKPAASTVTRAQVKAELALARQNGYETNDADKDPNFAQIKSTKTRAQVRAELVAARAEEAASGRHLSPEE